MDRSSTPKIVAAVLFVVGIGVALALPVIDADDHGEKKRRLPRTITPTPAPRLSPSTTITGETRTVRFQAEYPRCEAVGREPGFGLVVAVARKRTAVVTSAGEHVEFVRGRPPVRWSPSGRLLATGPHGDLWNADGSPFTAPDTQHSFVSNRELTWAWSPVTDCALAVDDRGSLFAIDADTGGIPQTYGVVLLDRGVESFAFSPDGRRAGLVIREGDSRSIWVASLTRSRMHEVKTFWRRTCCVVLGGWSPDGGALLYWAGPGVSVMADGWTLRSVSLDGEVSRWGVTLPRRDVLAHCGDDLVALVGGDRFQEGNRLAILRANEPPTPLTEPGNYSGFTCSSDGRYIAAVREVRLVLLNSDGSFVRRLTGRPRFTELEPDWGPPRTGLVFVRQTGLVRQLWSFPRGARHSTWRGSGLLRITNWERCSTGARRLRSGLDAIRIDGAPGRNQAKGVHFGSDPGGELPPHVEDAVKSPGRASWRDV